MCKWKETFENNKKWLCFALLSVFLWGLAAHGYGFFHNSFSHDSLTEFDGLDGSNDVKIRLGRIVVPLYRAVFRTSLTLPWLIGLLSLLWIGLAVFIVIRLFRIENRGMIFVTAGIFTVNMAVSALGSTYMHDLDSNMFAMLCAVAAVACWRQNTWKSLLLGAVPVAVSMGIYQSFVSVTIVLVMFVCILDLLNEEAFRNVLLRGLKAIGMILVGGILYYIVLQLVLRATGMKLASGGGNSLDVMLQLTPAGILRSTVYGYFDCFKRLWKAFSPYPAVLVRAITAGLILIVAAAAAVGLWNKKVRWLEKLLCLVLFGLLPLGMNLMYVLTSGNVHGLMMYALWLFYLLALLLADWLGKRLKTDKAASRLRLTALALVAVLMYGNVQTANALYLKKNMEQDAFLSMMTRIVYRMEDYDDYEAGVNPVVFVGRPQQLLEEMPGFEDYTGIIGQHMLEAADTEVYYRIQRYFRYVLATRDIPADEKTWSAVQSDPRVREMPCYPADGCIALLDDVLVVKLGETEE